MTQCALCEQEVSEGREVTIWTGQTVGSSFKMGRMETQYGNFQDHTYLICPSCQAARERWVFRALLVHIVLVALLTILFTWALENFVLAVVTAVGVAIVPAVISLLIYIGKNPASKLKTIARAERSRAEGTRETFLAFSQYDYNKLRRDW